MLVIDDGSSDGTGAAVHAEFPSVEVMRGDGRMWWTGAIAAGMSHAFAVGATAVCWLNDDCLPEAGTLGHLAAHAAAHPGELVAPVCVAASDGSPIPTAFIGRRPLVVGATSVQTVDGVSGFCVWVPLETWRRAGVPDAAHFPHYYGDTAYMLVARRVGCQVTLLSTCLARLVHYVPRSTTVGEFLAKLPSGSAPWPTTFVSLRSPFRLATQFNYLRLRYGAGAGTLLALARLAGWQVAFAAALLRRRRPAVAA